MLGLIALTAGAAEVVWTAPPTPAQRARIGQLADAAGPPLDLVDLRAAATRATEADDAALRGVDAALEQARAYETRLDGELLIVNALDRPVAAVTLLRDDSDRTRLFAALAYQGFAVDRYWGARFPAAPDAAPYRAEVGSLVVARPWLDAIALDPGREATAYEIAEAPQRIAYNALRSEVLQVVPALLVPIDLPDGARLVVDGRPRDAGPGGTIEVPPGRHLAHVELDGRIVGRMDVRARAAEVVPVAPFVAEPAWQSFLAGLTPGSRVPEPIGALVDALGGEVWLATPGEPPTVLALSTGGVSEIPVPAETAGSRAEASVGVLGGWLSSGDFYAQDPYRVPHSAATVNAPALGGFAGVDLGFGIGRIGAGVDLLATLGPDHVAFTGTAATRLRPVPYLAAGVRWAQATGGFLFPYHPAVGARLRLPMDRLEVRACGWIGVPVARARPTGSVWRPLPVYAITGGTGVRF